MEANYNAMMEIAIDKYAKLIEGIYKIKNGSDVDYEQILNLINSIHKDEIDLIARVHELKCEKESRIVYPNIQVFSFMH